MPAVAVINLVLTYGPELAEEIVNIFKNGGDMTVDEALAFIAKVKTRKGESYFK